MNKKLLLFLTILLGFSFFTEPVIAQEDPVEINFFYSDFCPHCTKERAFLDVLETQYESLIINKYSITSDSDAPRVLASFYKEYGISEKSWGLVPALFVGDEYFIGYSEEIKNNIIDSVRLEPI